MVIIHLDEAIWIVFIWTWRKGERHHPALHCHADSTQGKNCPGLDPKLPSGIDAVSPVSNRYIWRSRIRPHLTTKLCSQTDAGRCSHAQKYPLSTSIGEGRKRLIDCSADGGTALIVEYDTSIRAFDAATGKPTGEFRFGVENGRQMTTIRAGTHDMRLVVPTPDGKAVLFWGLEGKKAVLRVWDIGEKTARTLGDGDGVYAEDSIAVSPDGSWVATFRRHVGWTVRDTATAKEVGRIPQPGTRQRGVFSPDGKTLYAHGDEDSTVTVLDVAGGRAVDPQPDVAAPITDFRFDGSDRLTALTGGALTTWDIATGRVAARAGPFPVGKAVTSPRWAVSPDRRRVFRFDYYRSVDLSDAATGKVLWANDDLQLDLIKAAFDPAGGRVFAASSRSVVAFDAGSGEPLWTALADTGSGLVGTLMTVSPDGRSVVVAGGWNRVTNWSSSLTWVFDAATGKVLRSWETEGYQAVALAFAPDGRTLYVVETDRDYKGARVRGYSPETGKIVTTFGPLTPIPRGAAVSPDGRTLVVTSGRLVHLIELLTGRMRHTFTGHEGRVSAVRFRPDGRVPRWPVRRAGLLGRTAGGGRDCGPTRTRSGRHERPGRADGVGPGRPAVRRRRADASSAEADEGGPMAGRGRGQAIGR